MAVPPEQLPPPERSAEEIRSAAEEILSRAEFRDDESLYDLVLGWLGERLADILGVLAGGGRGAVIGWMLLLVASAAVAYLVVRIVRGGAVPRMLHRGVAGADVSVHGARRPASEWRAEADAHAAAGRWRDAVRCRWRAVVAELADRGSVEEIPGLTAGDYRAMVAATAPSAAPAFSDATDIFELAWYGQGEVAASDHDSLVAAAASMGSSLERTPSRPSTAPAGGGRS